MALKINDNFLCLSLQRRYWRMFVFGVQCAVYGLVCCKGGRWVLYIVLFTIVLSTDRGEGHSDPSSPARLGSPLDRHSPSGEALPCDTDREYSRISSVSGQNRTPGWSSCKHRTGP